MFAYHALSLRLQPDSRGFPEESIEGMTFEESLTGLTDRSGLVKHLEQLLEEAQSAEYRIGVFALGVDQLALINDQIGQIATEDLLEQLAERFRTEVRKTDIVARFAGDEFVLVCRDIAEPEAGGLAERIIHALRKPFELPGREILATVSIGIALSRPGESADELLQHAGLAMRSSKARHRGGAIFFDDRMESTALDRLDIESDLARAVERGELHVHYQPVIELATGRPVGVEALLRWKRPGYGPVSPDVFIPIAEETGLIIPMGEWVLTNALKQVRLWQEVPEIKDLQISVNLSAVQLQDRRLLDRVQTAIAAAGISAGTVELEITESGLMHDVDHSIETLSGLRELGVGLSIDDFGTGYSSLSYLNRLPITALKIDQSFVARLSDKADGRGAHLVKAIVSMASALDLDVVAEGVETAEQRTQLAEMGARLGQGFYWSKARPAAKMLPWLQAHYASSAAGEG